MTGIEEAVSRILERIKPLPPELVSLTEAYGRVLAEPVTAGRNLPPRDNSAMDGYAFIHPGDASAILTLQVAEEIAAGHPGSEKIVPGLASKIMTGAPMPEGADTVVPVEMTTRDGGLVTINELPDRGANVRLAGGDVREGMEIIPAGVKIRPAEVGMLAALGRSYVKVHQRPRVAVLATGDEIVEIDRDVTGGFIVNSNSYAISAQVAEAGGVPLMLGIGRDDPDGLMEMLHRAGTAEVVITTGGVSMGDYDYVPDVLKNWGVELVIRKVAMKPGKPMVFGTRGSAAVFGLPGNPVSAMVSFEQFVRPVIRKLCGCNSLFRPVVLARYGEGLSPIRGKGERTEFIRCGVARVGGAYVVESVRARESGMMSTLVKANALLVLKPGEHAVCPGDLVPVQIYDYEFLEGGEPGW